MDLHRLEIVGPEPVTVPEAKEHLRVLHEDEDALIGDLIGAAREQCEAVLRRSVVLQRWRARLDRFPAGSRDLIRLPRPPLASVESVRYRDRAGEEAEIDPAALIVDTDTDPGRIGTNQGWPSGTDVRIDFTGGHAEPADVPERWKQAIRFLTAHYYSQREPVAVAASASEIPMTVSALLGTDRFYEFA